MIASLFAFLALLLMDWLLLGVLILTSTRKGVHVESVKDSTGADAAILQTTLVFACADPMLYHSF